MWGASLAAIAIRQSAWSAATAVQKAALLLAMEQVGLSDADLGSPPLYNNPSAVAHYVFDDWRFTTRDAAILGVVGANMALVTAAMLPVTRAKVATFIASRIVWPGAIDYTNSTNVWQTTLDAQAAPTWMKMANEVPAGWTLVGGA
jgi:hypothetical protein